MLQSLRDNLKGTVAVIVVGLMVIPLMLFGVDSLFVNNAQTAAVAEVEGEEITETELQRAIFFRKNQLRQQFGDNLPEQFISDENLREPVLNTLVKRKVLVHEAREAGMTVPDQRVNQMILSASDFQVDGQFDQDRFRQLVRSMGYTPLGYRDQLAEDIILNQQLAGITSSGFITDKTLARTVALSQQERNFYYLTIPVAPIQASVEVSDAEAQTYYEEHKSQYTKPEQVSIEYLDLSLDAVAQGIQITEEELRAQYEQEVAAFDSDPERHAAHILLEPKDDGSVPQETVNTIKQRLEDGESFAELAKEYSQDLGSKSSGGDLGFTSGDTFPEPFENTLAQLEEGQVSDPVQTDAGYHLIKLLEVRGAQPPTFAEDRDRIERALRQSRAEDRFLALREDMEEMSYNAEDLEAVGEQLDIPGGQAGPFGRSGGPGIASNPKVLEAAFSDDVLHGGNTSPVLELNPERYVVLRVTDHQPSRMLTFDEVKDQVTRQLKREKAVAQAKERAAELADKVRAGQSIEEVAKANDYDWQVSLKTQRSNPQVRRELLNHVFAMPRPAEEDSEVDQLQLNNGDYAVINLTKVEDGDIDAMTASEKKNLRQRLAQQWSQHTYAAYEALLENRADIEIY